ISRAELIPCVDTRGPHAKAAGECGEVDGRIYEIHPDKALSAVEQLQPLLDDAVASIVEHDEDHRQLLVSGGPQRLDRVHGAAVAEQGDHLALRLGAEYRPLRRWPSRYR